jgi:hypothetical protein
MNTFQIEAILYGDPVTKNYFKGCYARDELPIVHQYPFCFILNTDPSDKPGEHWLAIYYNEQKQAEFFDPAGFHPVAYRLNRYLDTTSTSWKYNKKRIQGLFSHFCGHYCLLYLYARCRSYSLEEFQCFFSNDYDKNDEILIEKFKDL